MCRLGSKFIPVVVIIIISAGFSRADSIRGANVQGSGVSKTVRRADPAAQKQFSQSNASPSFGEHSMDATAYAGSGILCGYGSSCYKTVQAPEPQPLLMVGFGLITVAALLRRGWAR